jgi:hydroxymethylglutaryl-CoA lyase
VTTATSAASVEPGTGVRLVEVGPRDGLQNEQARVATADKIAFTNLLSAAGLGAIEVAAFVSPRWVPQMADAAEVLAGIERRPPTRYSALVPNLTGLERAVQARADEIAIFAAASETFSRRNINQGIDESLAVYREVARTALAAGIRVRGYLSTSFGCPYEGDVPPGRVAVLAERLLDLGVFEVALSDTIGIAHPGQVRTVLEAVTARVPVQRLALHFHDTRGTALANVLAGLSGGVRTFDSSAGGLGGCPYAPGAAGNLATEDLVYVLDGLGVRSGVRLPGVIEASAFIERRIDHALPSRVYQAERRHRPDAARDTGGGRSGSRDE